jgi:hypothetical protein
VINLKLLFEGWAMRIGVRPGIIFIFAPQLFEIVGTRSLALSWLGLGSGSALGCCGGSWRKMMAGDQL